MNDESKKPGTAVATATGRDLLDAIRPRLPYPTVAPMLGIDELTWIMLVNSIFPTARDPQKIMLGFAWCRGKNLDIMTRPINIVSVWNSQAGGYEDQIWPAFNEGAITAHRTGEFKGVSEPTFGPMKSREFKGEKRVKGGGWQNATVTVEYPEWCKITVRRGPRDADRVYEFTALRFWDENFARVGKDGKLPNDMWAKKAREMLVKVTTNAAIRLAFPEEGGDEREPGGVIIDGTPINVAGGAPVGGPDDQAAATEPEILDGEPAGPERDDAPAKPKEHEAPTNPETGEIGGDPFTIPFSGIVEDFRKWCEDFIAAVRSTKTVETIEGWRKANEKTLNDLNKTAPKMYALLVAATNKHKIEIEMKVGDQPGQSQETPDDHRSREPTIIGAG